MSCLLPNVSRASMKLGLDRAVLQSMSTPKETAVSVCMLHNVCMCVCPNVLVSVHVCACMVLCVRVCERQLGGGEGRGRGVLLSSLPISCHSKVPQMNKKLIEDLLKKGAYAAVMDEDDAGDRWEECHL